MRINEDFLDNETTDVQDVQTTSDGVLPEFVVFCNSYINNKKQRTYFINGFGRYVKRLAGVYLSDILHIDVTPDDPKEPQNISVRITLLPEQTPRDVHRFIWTICKEIIGKERRCSIMFFLEKEDEQLAQITNSELRDAYNTYDNSWYISACSELCAELCKDYTQKDAERLLTDFFVRHMAV